MPLAMHADNDIEQLRSQDVRDQLLEDNVVGAERADVRPAAEVPHLDVHDDGRARRRRERRQQGDGIEATAVAAMRVHQDGIGTKMLCEPQCLFRLRRGGNELKPGALADPRFNGRPFVGIIVQEDDAEC